MFIGFKIWPSRNGVEITIKETQGAVHDWVINKKQSEGEKLVEKDYQKLIEEI